MKFIFLLLLSFLISAGELFGQSAGPLSSHVIPMKIGDKVADIRFDFLNKTGNKSLLSDYKGKLVLLDFWATWCVPCLSSLPTVHALQEKFNDRIQIILMNDNQKKTLVEKFITKRSELGIPVTLPVALGDSITTKVLFKHQGIPVIYWIDGDGIIRNITSKVEVNENNILAFLEKQDIRVEDNSTTALVKSKDLLWRSELEKGKLGSNFAVLRTSNSGVSRIECKKCTVLDMYRFAYGRLHGNSIRERTWVENVPIGRVLFESLDTVNAGRHYFNYKQPDSTYSYFQEAPDFTPAEKMLLAMRRDLDNWFGLSVQWIKRDIKYLSLSIPDTTKLTMKDGKFTYKITDTELKLNKITIEQFMRNNNANLEGDRSFLPHYPIIDDSGYKGELGLVEIGNININDAKALDVALSRFGIRLQLKKMEIDMLVIRKADSF